MIRFFYETNFLVTNTKKIKKCVQACIKDEKKKLGSINYIFCNDDYLLNINQKYLNHNYYTDVIGFDYSNIGKISGDIYISIDRVKENSKTYNTTIQEEIYRVIIHGVLHLLGYTDKDIKSKKKMKEKENYYIYLFND